MVTEDGIARDGMKAGDVVVVTGAGGGFGRAFCRRFAREGGRVCGLGIDRKAGEEIVREIGAEGAEASFISADLSSRAEIEAAVDRTLTAVGVPYCIANNASIYPRASLIDMSPEIWERTLKVNITAPFLILRAFGPRMIASEARRRHQYRLRTGGRRRRKRRGLRVQQGCGALAHQELGARMGQIQHSRQCDHSGGLAHRAAARGRHLARRAH